MKIKEVARYCGLTEKAIRLYESRGLVRPITAERNGRNYREYDEKCLRDLMTVSILRRAEFSLEQIATMQKDPAALPRILEEYRASLDANIKNMTEVRDALTAYEATAPGIDALADALIAAIGGEQITERRERMITWRVWDEDLTPEQKQAIYLQFVEKQSKRQRAEDALLALPRRVGRFFGRIWARLRGGIFNHRGRVRGGVICAAIFLVTAMILGGSLGVANKRAAQVERMCVSTVLSSVRELDYLLTNVERAGEYTSDDSARACLILTQLTDAIAVAEALEGESAARANTLAGCMGSFWAVNVNGNRIEGILYDGEVDESELEFIRQLHTDAVAITDKIKSASSYSARYKDIRDGARAFVDKWCDISLDGTGPHWMIVKK